MTDLEKAEFWRQRCLVTEKGSAQMIARIMEQSNQIHWDYSSLVKAHERLAWFLDIVLDNQAD